MRTKFFTIAATALLLGFTSCNNNDDAGENGNELKGERTAMEFTIRAPRAPQTYALVDANAIDAELALKTTNVLIYNKTTSGSYTLESNTARVTGDFTLVSGTKDTYMLNDDKKIPVTTGDKKVFVAVNYTGTLPTAAGDPLNNLFAVTRTDMTVNELCTPAGESAGQDGFAMFSAKGEGKVLVKDEAQNIISSIIVKRLVAKMTVLDDITRTNGKIIAEGGELKNIQFAVGHINTAIYPFQFVGTNPVSVQDPNWRTFSSTDFSPVDNATYQAVNKNNATIDTMKVVYAPENTAISYDPDGANATYLSVRAQYIPAFFANADGTSKAVPTIPETFWTVSTPAGAVMYFNVEAEADNYVLSHSGSVKTPTPYTNGFCYYRIYLNKNGEHDASTTAISAAKYDVLRNTFYKATIKSIKALGRPVDEGNVIENTMIDVEVDVQPWQPVEDNYDL